MTKKVVFFKFISVILLIIFYFFMLLSHLIVLIYSVIALEIVVTDALQPHPFIQFYNVHKELESYYDYAFNDLLEIIYFFSIPIVIYTCLFIDMIFTIIAETWKEVGIRHLRRSVIMMKKLKKDHPSGFKLIEAELRQKEPITFKILDRAEERRKKKKK